MRMLIATSLILLVSLKSATAADSRKVEGRVLDEKGSPVSDASVDFFWRANGPDKDQNSTPIDPATEEGNKLFWGRLGQMSPFRTATSGADGRFSIDVPDRFYTLMAMDAQRVRGGLTKIPKGDSSATEIRLLPLIRVRGSFEGPESDKRPSWTHVWTLVPDDPTWPLGTSRLVSCGSHEARFAMSLPPGHYVLDANDDTAHGILEKEINLTGDKPDIDLGVLRLSRETRLNINEKIKQSQSSGAMRDYTKHYGEKLPAWHIVDARGVSKNVQLSDFQGKWVLVKFWALNCSACLRRELPELVKFYEEHEKQRDRFEVLAICVDCDEKMTSIADVDRALEPIIKYAWNNKPLPFPVLLDPSMKTLESFGIPGYETILLDPDGKLVEGDQAALASKLEK